MTTLYDDDFEARTVGDEATSFGWTGSSAVEVISANSGKAMASVSSGTASVERTFATGGTFDFDYSVYSGTTIKFYLDNVLEMTKSSGVGSDSITIADGEDLKIEFDQPGASGDTWVDNLLLTGVAGNTQVDPEGVRMSTRVEQTRITDYMDVDHVRMTTRVEDVDVTHTTTAVPNSIRMTTRVEEGVVSGPIVALPVRMTTRVGGTDVTYQGQGRPRPRPLVKGGAFVSNRYAKSL